MVYSFGLWSDVWSYGFMVHGFGLVVYGSLHGDFSLSVRFMVCASELRFYGLWFDVNGLRCTVACLLIMVSGLQFRASGLKCGGSGSCFNVSGFGFMAYGFGFRPDVFHAVMVTGFV